LKTVLELFSVEEMHSSKLQLEFLTVTRRDSC
jgi:hypothetical protein